MPKISVTLVESDFPVRVTYSPDGEGYVRKEEVLDPGETWEVEVKEGGTVLVAAVDPNEAPPPGPFSLGHKVD